MADKILPQRVSGISFFCFLPCLIQGSHHGLPRKYTSGVDAVHKGAAPYGLTGPDFCEASAPFAGQWGRRRHCHPA